MKNSWTKSLLGAAAALLFVGTANAYVIDFESLNTSAMMAGDTGLIVDGDVMTQGAFSIQVQDPNNPTLLPGNGPYVGDMGVAVGQISNGSFVESCGYGTTCPRGDTTTYLNILNDGMVHIGATDGSPLTFTSLQASYIAMNGNAAGSTVYLGVEVDRADGSFASYYFPLASNGSLTTVLATGGTAFGTGTSGTLTSGVVTDLFVYGLFCNAATGKCTAFNTDQANFALDNVTVDIAAAVPEPSEWLLMAAGLGAVGAIVRRRKNAAAAAA